MYDLISIGDSTLDTIIVLDDASLNCDLKKEHCLLCLNYADKISITHSEQAVGGNAANVAMGASHLDLKTAIITELGDDPNGQIIQKEFKNAKIDFSLSQIIKQSKTKYGIVLNYKGERTILTCQVKRNYSLPVLPPTSFIYYTSLGKTFEKLQAKLEKHLNKNPKIRLAMNPGSYQLHKGLGTIKKLFHRMEIFFANKEEMDLVLGDKKNIQESVTILHKMGIKNVIITDGDKGSYGSDGKNLYHLATFPVPLISKTGAGDAYTSGFLAATIANKTLPEAMQWGTANSCAVIQKFGAQINLLNPITMKKMLKKFSSIKPEII